METYKIAARLFIVLASMMFFFYITAGTWARFYGWSEEGVISFFMFFSLMAMVFINEGRSD